MKKSVLMSVLTQVFVLFAGVVWAAGKSTDTEALTNVMTRTIPLTLLFMVIIAVIYFIPSIVGYFRKKDNFTAIVMLNFFLGWSLIGWVVALVWAVSKDKQPQTIIINNTTGTQSN